MLFMLYFFIFEKLIGLYMYICDVYQSSLHFSCQRFGNNSNPKFTDEKVLAIYPLCGYCQTLPYLHLSILNLLILHAYE